MHEMERHLRTAEVARRLHVSPKTISRWAREGKLEHVTTFGGHRRYREGAVNALVEQLIREGGDPSGA
jgi:excisionase family DNA binding protein